MSEHSFKFIALVIIDYFRTSVPLAGERFHVQFEKEDDVYKLHDALGLEARSEIEYKGYTSPLLETPGADIVIASSHNANEHFLTNLRNRTAEQSDHFHGKALLIVHHTELDSIVGGAESLSKESRPLHAAFLRNTLIQKIEASSLVQYEKQVLKTVIGGMRDTTYEDVSSVFAYFPFMEILEKKGIELSSWGRLGLFPDSELDHLPDDRAITQRIEENAVWFERVQTINRFAANPADELERYYSNAGVNALTKDDWMSCSYGKVAKWHQEKLNKTLPEYKGIEQSLVDGIYDFWERADGTTSAASKRKHIICFNKQRNGFVEFSLKFDSRVQQGSVKLTSNPLITTEAKGKTVVVRIDNCNEQCVIDRLTYQDQEATGKYIFNIAILPFSQEFIYQHRANYKVNGAIRSRCLQLFYDGALLFNPSKTGEERVELESDGKVTLVDTAKTLAYVDKKSVDEEKLKFHLVLDGIEIPCEIYTDSVKPVRITGSRISKWKREKNRNFEYIGDNKLIFGNEEYFTHRSRTKDFLDLEREIISGDGDDCFWHHNGTILTPQYVSIGDGVRRAYRKLHEYYRRTSLLPSLSTLVPELKDLMQTYVEEYLAELTTIEEGIHLLEEKHNLLKIGSIYHSDGENQIFFTPLHPLNVAFQLELNGCAQQQEVSEEIVKCLSTAELLPYINNFSNSAEKMQPVPETELQEWTVYKPCHTSSRGWHNEYVQKLICEKIESYIKHFPDLFTGSVKAPVRVNLIHLGDCTDALKGIVLYFKNALVKSEGDFSQVNPLNICAYGDHGHSNRLEEITRYSDPQLVLRDFGINLEGRSQKSIFDGSDVLKILQEKLRIYLKPIEENLDYAHISFFRFNQSSIEYVNHPMESIRTGASLGGVVNAVPSVFRRQEYLTGFGAKDLPPNESELLKLARNLNALARVASTRNSYSCKEATFAALKEEQKVELDKVYDSSNWVTLIDPKVDLNFFQMHETAKDLIIIHYSDQYNNSGGYDAITVTRKSKQYQAILNEYLKNRDLVSSQADVLKLINMFNAINGDWLLQLISGKKHFPREKISILSAVKTMMAFLRHSKITWIPLSLEEILRVSGGIGLRQTEGLFSAKNLGEKGPYCDDLLLAGIERVDSKTTIHLYPVEVKIGVNNASVLEKAKKQSKHTAATLRKFLSSENDDFTGKFYRNFFAKLILSGAEKMELYQVAKDVDWKELIEDNRSDLLSDSYNISWDLEKSIGEASILSFQKDCFKRNAEMQDNCLMINLPESDGYLNLLTSVSKLNEIYRDPETSISEKLLLENQYFSCEAIDEGQTNPIQKRTQDPLDDNQNGEAAGPEDGLGKPVKVDVEVILGKSMLNGSKITWKPGNLTNPHVMILGASGKGKTQTVKSFIFQLAQQGVPSVVIDFNDDFIDQEFLTKTGFSYQDASRGIEVNPLEIQVDPVSNQKVSYQTVVYSLPDTLSDIFGLGSREKRIVKTAISEIYVENGYSSDPTSWNGVPPQFDILQEWLEIYAEDNPKEEDRCYNILSKLSPLFDLNIFRGTEEDTFDHYFKEGVVFRLKSLGTYGDSVQSAVMQFILEKVYNRMLTLEHSHKLRFCCIVDEAHYLKMNKKIDGLAKEARKFGIGLVLSTQEAKDLSPSVWANTNTSVALGLSKKDADAYVGYLGIPKGSQETISLQVQNFNPFEAILKNDQYSPYEAAVMKPYYQFLEQL